MIIQIQPAFEGRMLRSFLKLTLGLSSSALAKLKANPVGILVNGAHVTVRYILHAGDELSLSLDDSIESATETVLPCEAPLDVLYEDDSIIVLNKPADMPTHPSHGHLTDTLANALAFRYAEAGIPFTFRPLGRLDRNTSGAVICGKTLAAAGFLGNCLKAHLVVKRYLAVLDGEMPADKQIHSIEVPILPPSEGVKMRTAVPAGTQGAEYALTYYHVVSVGNGHSLVLCSPVTGRTHQLRVHFSSVGFPITGDDVYGRPSALVARQALHCLSLSFPMPFSGTYIPHKAEFSPDETAFTRLPSAGSVNCPACDGIMNIWAPPPTDFSSLCATLFPILCPLSPRSLSLIE